MDEKHTIPNWSAVKEIVSASDEDYSNYSSSELLDWGDGGGSPLESNVTSPLSTPEWAEDVKPYLEIVLLALVIIMMLSMGCEVALEHILLHIKRPISLCIGMATQFFALPLFTFVVLVVCQIKNLYAAGVLIVSCCPGGVLSNTFTYLCEGDLSLSIAMTTASTIVAMGMLPVNTWLYGRQFESNELVIPYVKMAFSMIVVTSPALVGMAIKWKFPNGASRLARVGVHIGLILIIIYTTTQVAILYNKFAGIPPTLHAVILLLPITGFCLGYSLATLTKQTPAVRKTIAIETGVQNLPLAVTIISLSFPPAIGDEILVIPFLYAFTMVGGATFFCIAYSCYRKYAKEDIKYLETPQNPPTSIDIEKGCRNGSLCEQNNLHVCTVNGRHNGFVKYSNGTSDSQRKSQDVDGEILLKQ